MRVEDDIPTRERWTGDYDDSEGNESDEIPDLGKHRSKDNNKNNGHREEKDYKSRNKERLRMVESSKEREKENKDSASSKSRRKDRDERVKAEVRDRVTEKDVDREKHREKERDKGRRDRGQEKEQERRREKDLEKDGDRGRDTDRGREKIRDKDKDREKERDRAKDKEREKQKDREREKDNGRDRFKEVDERDKGKEKTREKEKQAAQEKDRARDRGRSDRRQKDGGRERSQGVEEDVNHVQDHQSAKEVNIPDDVNASKILHRQQNADVELVAAVPLDSSNLEERLSKMREERMKNPAEGASEVLSWVNRSRKLEQKRTSEKERALQLSKVFEEQDNMDDEGSDDEKIMQHTAEDLGGVKILHGLDKVLEGGAVVLTLKDQNILADSDINQEVDVLENVEIGEQKRRDEAYRAATKKTGVYDDKFNDELGSVKKMLPQYDDPVTEEGVTLDSSGRFTGEAERKLEELRKRIQGVPASNLIENLNSIGKISTDYYTEEEMMKFKKPKKKKSLRKKDKLDIDALEAEAISYGLGAGDLGSRSDGRRHNLREEQERIETEKRRNAYQSAYAKADEASKALRPEEINSTQTEEDDTFVFGDDDDELRKSLERARKIALKKQDEDEKFAPQVITLLATSSNDSADNSNHGSGDQQENKVVFTEMEEFVWGLQIDEDAEKPDQEDVFMEEDAVPDTSDQEMKDGDVGWAEVKETAKDEMPAKEEEEVVPDETIHESAVGKGLAGALKLLKDRGTLKETIEWGGRNMDKKKSKLVGIYDNDGAKEILIERTDEYGRILTPKESFRLLSHKFHGKGPGKMKQEKRMRQYQEELKVKQMKNADTPSLSVERMRDAQAKLQTPYLVLSGHVKPGQTIDPGSGFATVEKDLAGGLTPMLGNRKVEHFLNIKRKSEPGDAAAQKKPKT